MVNEFSTPLPLVLSTVPLRSSIHFHCNINNERGSYYVVRLGNRDTKRRGAQSGREMDIETNNSKNSNGNNNKQ